MKKYKEIIVILILMISVPLGFSKKSEWGFYAHREINNLAIFTLPQEMLGFYKENYYFIKEHAVDPDKRRYGVKGEAQRHFIDIDHYCYGNDSSCNPFDLMPRRWSDAIDKYTEDTLQAYGIVPWHISVMEARLTKAFKDKNYKRILRLSTELGHYIGDAHVPLHTTENYNGQYTNQRGIHGFWESRLPELFDEKYDFFSGQAKYVDSPLNRAWDFVEESHNALDSVLTFEAELSVEWPEDKKYSYEERGVVIMKVYSREYSDEYHRRLNGQVERRMRQTIATIGDYWYTAWVNAGQPELPSLKNNISIIEELNQEIKDENSNTKKDSLVGVRDHE